jgi:hypothetical protein
MLDVSGGFVPSYPGGRTLFHRLRRRRLYLLVLQGKVDCGRRRPDACETNKQGFTDRLFTSDGVFTVPCTGIYAISAVGGGGGGNWWSATGGGSTALYIIGQTPIVLAGGSGGSAEGGSGASGEVEIKLVSLV